MTRRSETVSGEEFIGCPPFRQARGLVGFAGRQTSYGRFRCHIHLARLRVHYRALCPAFGTVF